MDEITGGILASLSGSAVQGSQMKEVTNVYLRYMKRADLMRVLEIERNSFVEPWKAEDFLIQLRRGRTIGLVAELLPPLTEIVGFAIYELNWPELILLNLAVDPGYRRQRVATQIVNTLKSRLIPRRRDRIYTLVDDANLGAHLFFQVQGFKAIGVCKIEYGTDSTDGYHFQYVVGARDSALAGYNPHTHHERGS